MKEDFEHWWDKEGQYSELCGKELCLIAWSNGEYKAHNIDNLGLAESIIKQQELQIEALKAQLNPYKVTTNTKIEPTVISYTHPVKELTETDLILILEVLIDSYDDTNRGFLEYEAMYKNSSMRKARIDGMKRMVDKHTHAIEMVEAILRKAQEK